LTRWADILLDEPANDLDIETLQDLNGSLEQFVGRAAMVSHHRGSSTCRVVRGAR
jgi:ATPase subunit of ABC transporter with duplicated ATPase domains